MWDVTTLKLATSAHSQTSDALYANGRMQVPVHVEIRARDRATGNTYRLTESELNGIELVDYYDTSRKITGSWFYSDHENEYSHSLLSVASDLNLAVDVARANQGDGSQFKTYWVSTTMSENKNIGARVLQPGGTMVTSHGDNFDTHVTLTGRAPITYTTDSINVQREETAKGTYKGKFMLVYASLPWNQ